MTPRSRPSVRADLSSLPGYHSPQVDVEVRLNTNEFPFPPPDGWFDKFAERVSKLPINRYPDREAVELRQSIASLHGVDAANVFCANGSNEVIQILLQTYGGAGRSAGLFDPTYAMHSQIAHLTGTGLQRRQRNEDFTLDAPAVAELAPLVDVLFLCSPNNPTGVVDAPGLVSVALASTSGVIAVDEAYGQFASWSAQSLMGEEVPLAVLRTFSKTWGMAGVRLGYLLGPTWMVDDLWKTSLPYHVSSFTQTAGVLALEFEAEMHERVSLVVSERERLAQSLSQMAVRQWPSQSNYILIRPTSADAKVVWQQMVDASVLVRDCSSWPRLEGCLRVTIGTPAENDRFLTALGDSLT